MAVELPLAHCDPLGDRDLDQVVFLHPETWTLASVAHLGADAAQLAARAWLTYPNGELAKGQSKPILCKEKTVPEMASCPIEIPGECLRTICRIIPMVARLTAIATAFPPPPLPLRNAEMAAPVPLPGTAIRRNPIQSQHGACACRAGTTRTR